MPALFTQMSNLAPPCDSPFGQGLHVGELSHVDGQAIRLGAATRQLLDCRVDALLGTCGHHDGSPFRGVGLGDGQSQPACAARDDCDLVLQNAHG